MQTLSRDQPQPPRACRNLMSEQSPVPRAEKRLLSSRTPALWSERRPLPPSPSQPPTGLSGTDHGRSGLAAAATVIAGLFYLWPPGTHTASPLLVV